MKRRLIAVMLSIMLTLPVGVLSESTAWTCPNCNQTGNTGNFCSNCATARPSDNWKCTNCGQTGNTGIDGCLSGFPAQYFGVDMIADD